MKINFKLMVIVSVILILSLNVFAEEKSTDTLMGLAIQSYLEGNAKKTIIYLDQVLTSQPDYDRAKNLLEKAVNRLTEEVKLNKNFNEGMPFIEIGLKHLPEFESIKANMKELKKLMEPEKEETAAPEAVKVKKKKPEKAVEDKKAVEYKRKISRLNTHIKKLERNLASAVRTDAKITPKIEEITNKMDELNQKLFGIGKKLKKSGISIWTILILTILVAGGLSFIYVTLKKENFKLIKNIGIEKQALEELKVAHNRDTEELAKKLLQYAKSHQRADQMEKKWAKILAILEKLTRDGSTEKVILRNSPDGRKAVTGVDPKIRARADSVEIIADVFKDSPRAIEMLAPFLSDSDNRTRANAAVSYYQYDPGEAMTVLQEMATSKDKWMRLSAAWALGQIGDTSTSKILEKLLDDSDSQVKSKARSSLEKILEKGERA